MVPDGKLDSGDGHADGGRTHTAGLLEWASRPGGCADQGTAPSLSCKPGPAKQSLCVAFRSTLAKLVCLVIRSTSNQSLLSEPRFLSSRGLDSVLSLDIGGQFHAAANLDSQ